LFHKNVFRNNENRNQRKILLGGNVKKITDIRFSGKSKVLCVLVLIILFGTGILWADRKPVELPEWFYELPMNQNCVYGIGISDSGHDSEIDAYLQAVDRARVALSFFYKTECSSMIKKYEYEEKNELVKNFSITTRLSAKLLPESFIEVTDKFVLPGGVVLVLAKMDESEVEINLLSEIELEYYIQEVESENYGELDWELRLISDIPAISFRSEYKSDSVNKKYYNSKSGDSSYPEWYLTNELDDKNYIAERSIALLDGTASSLNSAYWRCFASGVSSIIHLYTNELSIEQGIKLPETMLKIMSENEFHGFYPVKLDFTGEKKKQNLVMQIQVPRYQSFLDSKREEELYNQFKTSKAFKDLEDELKNGEE